MPKPKFEIDFIDKLRRYGMISVSSVFVYIKKLRGHSAFVKRRI